MPPAIRGKSQIQLWGRQGIRWISFRASCNTKHDKTSQYKWTLQERCDVTTAFLHIVHLWTLESLNLISDHVINNLITLHCSYWRYQFFEHCKKALKLVQCVCECFFLWTVLKMLSPRHSSVVCRLNGYGAQLPTTFAVPRPRPLRRRPPTAPGETAWGETALHLTAQFGYVEAAQLLLSNGAAVDAKNSDGRGPPVMGSRARNPISNGALQKAFRAWILGKMFAFLAKCLAKS